MTMMEKIVLLLAFYFSHPYEGKTETWITLVGDDREMNENAVINIIDRVINSYADDFDFSALDPFKEKQIEAQNG
jgi:hypothetical protein